MFPGPRLGDEDRVAEPGVGGMMCTIEVIP
jgi:hypothetical protein